MANDEPDNPGFLLPPPLTYLLPLVFGLLLDRRIQIPFPIYTYEGSKVLCSAD